MTLDDLLTSFSKGDELLYRSLLRSGFLVVIVIVQMTITTDFTFNLKVDLEGVEASNFQVK